MGTWFFVLVALAAFAVGAVSFLYLRSKQISLMKARAMQISKAKWSRVKIKVARNLSWAEVQIGNFDVMPNELVTLKIKKAHENFESYVNFPGGIIAFDYSDRSYLPIGIRLIYGATDPSDYLFLKLYSPRRNK